MAMNETTAQDYRLPCGRELEQVWARLDQIEQGHPDAHEATCPYCRAAYESLLALRAATSELLAEPDTAPPDMVGRIMSAVRAEVRRGRTLDLPTPRAGSVEVSEQAVAAILRFAADSVPGVRARRCRIREAGTGPDGARLLDVEMTVAVHLGPRTLGELLPEVRTRITAALPDRVGAVLHRLDLHVGDLYEHDSDTDPGGGQTGGPA
ncbi:anti-sigma factor family protein [Nocardia sp. NBC_00416]|uniref:anti-sigma factor family protein n=1 Tax=Nocardia sp. NBC_00416 TaxID=2975991 RepID=UPI002E1A9E30